MSHNDSQQGERFRETTSSDDPYLPGALSLLDQLDKKVLVVLRDGKTLIGYLRTIDQFGNLVLHRTIERIHVGKAYGDIPRGIFLIRGENVVLAGEIDLEKEERSDLHRVSIEEILTRQREEMEAKNRLDEARNKALKDRGLQPTTDILQEDMF